MGKGPGPRVHGEGVLAWTPGRGTQAALICHVTVGPSDLPSPSVKWAHGFHQVLVASLPAAEALLTSRLQTETRSFGQSNTECLLCADVGTSA